MGVNTGMQRPPQPAAQPMYQQAPTGVAPTPLMANAPPGAAGVVAPRPHPMLAEALANMGRR